MDKETITVVIVDDHDLVRQGMAKLIENTPSLALLGEAEGIDDAKALFAHQTPGVAIIDLSLKKGDGCDLIRYIAQEHPETKIVVLSMHEDAVRVQEALHAGAHGYVAKSAPAHTLIEAIEEVVKGELYLPPELASRVLSRLQDDAIERPSIDLLSVREHEIFDLIGKGLTTRQAAETLNRSVKTIESHIERIKLKLVVKTGHELHRLAYQYCADSSDR